MGYLLTAGVLGFQVVIFLTIVGAGAIGRGKLWLVTAGWVIFTLFGSIFTVGLLLLQLLTIAVSYSVGSAAARRGVTQPKIQPLVVAPPKIEEPGSSGFEVPKTLLVIGGILWLAYIFVGSTHQAAPAPVVQATPAAPIVEVQAVSRVAEATPKISSNSGHASQRRTRNNSAPSDLRHCLALKTNQAIARCTEQAN